MCKDACSVCVSQRIYKRLLLKAQSVVTDHMLKVQSWILTCLERPQFKGAVCRATDDVTVTGFQVSFLTWQKQRKHHGT